MYVCVCKAVREQEILSLADLESGLRMRDLRERLGVCSECGKCGERALGLLRSRGRSCCETGQQLKA
ncbi:BFD domain protein (2Fe-2S)-binding domain protein [Thioalkalivibrio nitratireducens DSM 14787]|uniref:BFD domain protein (2Fe-2S)-binding domain protein n=1 Tax=Thioalkalivibrio nitratireducens (strain DSM 14787 / UNIQEM 213 / ALEN2) TaxID=1255043 RepID=L0DYN4_THIND|nr:(2Fe-2S)-binding protein [Thioalkalivibrio nitratireducens]AGA34117.1 BFD domain protein (2Fe-2S)-binding domain protein [Thioalkalivibrio nitratireducens DSM 14787]